MAFFNPNIPTVDIEQVDAVTGLVTLGTVTGTPPTPSGIFADNCILQGIDGTLVYRNAGTSTVVVWASLTSGAIGPTGYTGPNIVSEINFGPAGVTSITVVNGIITAIS